nr:unnamed protein product [Spirometra erinaceieuropaei]
MTLTVLGERQLIEKLVAKNRDIIEPNPCGYDIVHIAAIWDNAKLIKALYFCGVDLKCRTSLGEDAVNLAKRYHSEDAIKMFTWIELRESFVALIQQARNILKSADKMGIKLTKEERRSAEAACTEKENWLNLSVNRSLEELKAKKEHLELIVEPIFVKFDEEV